VIALPEVFIGLSEPRIQIFESVGSSMLTVRIRAHQEVASMFGQAAEGDFSALWHGLIAP
jgi:hypothetical protein